MSLLSGIIICLNMQLLLFIIFGSEDIITAHTETVCTAQGTHVNWAFFDKNLAAGGQLRDDKLTNPQPFQLKA